MNGMHIEHQPLEVWYLDSGGVWTFFYDHYGDDFKWAIDDARKTLGIDIWAIAQGRDVLAWSKDAPDLNGLLFILDCKEALR